MTRYHGITSETYKKFTIDAGAVYTGFIGFASPGTLLGATRTGSQLVIEQEIKEMEVDGARGPVIGSRRITRVKASLTVNFIEHSLTNLKRALVGSTSATFETTWDAITRGLVIADADFLTDVTIIADTTATSGNPMAIKLDNVMSDGNFELSFADKEEGVLAVTFTAHFDPSDVDSEPWTVYWPQ